MNLLKSYILPHPPMLIPEIAANRSKTFEAILDSYESVALEIEKLQPETIVIMSPHAESYGDTFKIAEGKIGNGDLSKYGESTCAFRNVYDTQLVDSIIEECQKLKVQIFSHGGSERSYDHGTMIPLYFINKKYSSFKLVRIGVSGLSYFEHYRLGQAIRNSIENSNKKVVFISSGDFSHCQLEEGTYGYNENGPKYDSLMRKILESGDFGQLLNIDKKFVTSAKACGHRTFVTLSGLYDRKDVECSCLCHEMHYGTGYGVYCFSDLGSNPSRAFGDIYLDGQVLKINNKKNNFDSIIRCAYYELEKEYGLNPSLFKKDTNLMQHNACFVSLYKYGELRGSIGTLTPKKNNLQYEIATNVVKAAKNDPRFKKVEKEELPYIDIFVDVIESVERVASREQLNYRKYGLIVTSLDGKKKGVVLPNSDGITSTLQQIEYAKQKAGIPQHDKVFFSRFEVKRYG